MKYPRANYSTDSMGAAQTQPEEIAITREPVAFLTHEMLLSVTPDMAVVRVFSKGTTAAHIGMTPERAIKVGEAFLRAGYAMKPALRPVATEPLQVVEGSGT